MDIKKIKRLDQLIRLKATGTPENLSRKLNISKRMVYYYMHAMKEMGASIKYCKHSCSYIYEENVVFRFGYYKEV